MKKPKRSPLLYILLFSLLICLVFTWLGAGLDRIYFGTDFARDLSELSKLWTGTKVIWLGPHLTPGLHASPLYYYVFFIPLVLSQGNAYSLVVFNLLLGTVAVGLLGFLGVKKWGAVGVLPMLTIGLSAWWQSIVLHPGNGYTYVIFLLFSLICLWFELPILLSAFFLGISIAFHPAAIFAVLLLFYEWWRRKYHLVYLLPLVVCLIWPWSPIILFEIITKGYLMRELKAHPGTVAHLQVQPKNLLYIASISDLNAFFGVMTLVVASVAATATRLKVWLFIVLAGLIFFGFISAVPGHHVLGITCITWFVLTVIFVQKKWGVYILVLLIVLFSYKNVFIRPTITTRKISTIEHVATVSANSHAFDKTKKIAVVAALDPETLVPQADDYRFFLRMKGYKVLEVVDYSKADILIMFIEFPQFKWQKWSTWEINQFGNKKVIDKRTVDGIEIITFSKKS